MGHPKRSFESKVEELQQYPISKFVNFEREVNRNKRWDIEVSCKKCGHTWTSQFERLKITKNCPSCLRKNLPSNEEYFFKEFNKLEFSKNIIIKFEKVNGKIDCECKICGYKWSAPPLRLLKSKYGCQKCMFEAIKKEKEIKNEIKSKEKLNKKFKHIKCTKYISMTSQDDEFYCEKHNLTYNTAMNLVLRSSAGCCPQCIKEVRHDKITLSGKEFQKRLSEGNKSLVLKSKYENWESKVDILCKDCGTIIHVSAGDILRRPKCPYCQDGWSFPNKFIRSFLFQSDADYFEFEYSPDWANKKRYDAYFEKNGKPYIIEMDGKQHYKDCGLFDKLEHQMENDTLKDELAKAHNIKMIRIDCSNQKQIKNKILSSELSTILNIEQIDFDECNKYACNSLMKSVCERYEEDKSVTVKDLSEEFKLSIASINRYLNFGNELGLCIHNRSEAQTRRNKKNREVI